jgi:hypothetical protein
LEIPELVRDPFGWRQAGELSPVTDEVRLVEIATLGRDPSNVRASGADVAFEDVTGAVAPHDPRRGLGAQSDLTCEQRAEVPIPPADVAGDVANRHSPPRCHRLARALNGGHALTLRRRRAGH